MTSVEDITRCMARVLRALVATAERVWGCKVQSERIAVHREGRLGQLLNTMRRSQVSFGLNSDMGLVLVLLRENSDRI